MEEKHNEVSEMKVEGLQNEASEMNIEEVQNEASKMNIEEIQNETNESNTEKIYSETTAKVVDRKRVILAAIILLIILITTGVYAYFTSMKTATNVFTIGSIDIVLTEGDVWDTASENGEAPESARNIEPGQHITKAPNVENVGKNPAYVYLKVYVPVNNEQNLFSYTINETEGETGGWTQREGEEMHTTIDGQLYNIYVYEYDETLEPGTTTEQALFDEVIFAENIYFTPEQVAEMGAVKKIIVKAYAIQSESGVEKSSNDITTLALGDSNEDRGLVGQIQVGDKLVGNQGSVKLLKGASDVQISFENSQGATYTSSETGVATVSNEGVINAIDVGTTTISIGGDGIQAKEFEVQVVENVQNATIKVGDETVVAGTAVKLKAGDEAQITTENGEDMTYSISPTDAGITVDSTGKITVAGNAEGGATATITLTGKLSGDTRTIEVKVNIRVGDKVKYYPTGTSTWEGALATSNGGADVALDARGNYKVTTWKVLSVDGDNIKLVPLSAVGSLTLQGPQGYNNSVYLLDKVCSELYSDSNKGITATSIKTEDFEKYMTASALSTTRGSGYNKQPGKRAYSKAKSWYPQIYATEANRVINGVKTTSGLGLSESNGPITANANGGKVQAGTSIQPVHTYYILTSSAFLGGVKPEYDSVKSTLSSMLFSSRNYWVASRCVRAASTYGAFIVRDMYSRSLNAPVLFNSDDVADSYSRGLFPVVSLSSDNLQESATSGYNFEVK